MPVAHGGLGQVWVARLRGARGFHKLVAIKTLLPAAGDAQLMEQRLLEDLRVAALIQHSNVAQTLELDEQRGTLYAVMEWVDGEPLSAIIESAGQGGGVPLMVAVNLIGQTLRGLQAAHEHIDDAGVRRPVVHRDVSPDNILVSYTGIAKLVDFGIARAKRQDRTLGRDNRIERSLGYAAPEQVVGGAVDQRTDLFAVGVTLYLLTTGRHPFHGRDSAATLRNIVSDEPVVRPSALKTSYSRTLEAVVMKALEKDRDRRWPSAEECAWPWNAVCLKHSSSASRRNFAPSWRTRWASAACASAKPFDAPNSWSMRGQASRVAVPPRAASPRYGRSRSTPAESVATRSRLRCSLVSA
jgi:eukaryotic-like serine/threonine-protein kinase